MEFTIAVHEIGSKQNDRRSLIWHLSAYSGLQPVSARRVLKMVERHNKTEGYLIPGHVYHLQTKLRRQQVAIDVMVNQHGNLYRV